MADPKQEVGSLHAHWARTRCLTLHLMLIWLGATFGIIFFARELSNLRFFGWPLSFYLAAQGAVLLYTAIVGIYAYKMRALDQRLRQDMDGGDVE
jgi:putative solute:sodium symporter small subunit